MKLSEWQAKAEAHEQAVVVAEQALEKARVDRGVFFMETIGMVPGGPATLAGSIEMISRIIDMKKEERPLYAREST